MSNLKETPPSLVLQITALEELNDLLIKATTPAEKNKILDARTEVQEVLKQNKPLKELLQKLKASDAVIVKTVLAIGQGQRVFKGMHSLSNLSKAIEQLLQTLREIERSYDSIGGVVGYHLAVLRIIAGKHERPSKSHSSTSYDQPPGIDISSDTPEVRRAIRWGITEMHQLTEIYPVGGAGDRLNLHDDISGEALPAAALMFCGRSLIEILIRDLQAREYLHYKTIGRQITTPIAMMTSQDKDNHKRIHQMCAERQWFGRPPNSFRLFEQPLVPVVTINGDWVVEGPLQLMLKPGGHGVIWKQLRDSKVIDWLMEMGCKKAIVRQINNPVAGLDYGLCALYGWGCHHEKAFGFASCPRLLNATEGMDVLIKSIDKDGVEYCITNIEYTEFERHGLQDLPASPKSQFSLYPANTNILFANLDTIARAIEKMPIPGMLINLKHFVHEVDANGVESKVLAGRLESTMQNIADVIVDRYPTELHKVEPKHLKSFVTYNHRGKTISVSKKGYIEGESILETPEGCFFDILHNHYDLLKNYCKVDLPHMNSEQEYLQNGPAFLIDIHPALGPLYQVISQKIRGGTLANGAEMHLEIAELDLSQLHLEGSLIIYADTILGRHDSNGVIQYGDHSGKCELHRVTIKNKGINRQASNQYWKHQVTRQELCQILLHGNAEFFAEDVTFNGQYIIEVPDGHRMIAYMHGSQIHYKLEKLSAPTWNWKYAFDDDDRIVLTKQSSHH